MFNKNLEFINNDNLKKELLSLSIDDTKKDMSYCMTTSNDYLIMKNEVPIDDIENPREAVRQMLSSTIKQEMKENDIIINFGIGLGYLLDETFNAYPSKIIIYEPDIKLLHFVLNNIDISEHLSSGRVFIFNKLEDLINKLNSTYITKDKVEIVYLKNYAIVKNKELIELTQKVYEACKSKIVDINTIARYSKIWAVNTINNIGKISGANAYALSSLENKFEGQTALIIAAGPSFKDNVEKIKAKRDKYVIFAVNKVIKDLVFSGIIPDFAVFLDAQHVDLTVGGLEEYFPKMNCIVDIKASDYVLKQNFKKAFVTFSQNDTITKHLSEFNPDIKLYECGGSASVLSFVAAIKLGFRKIIFSGLDLAFKNGTVYSTGEAGQQLSENQILISNTIKNLTTVKSVNGSDVQTTDDYAAFITHFETLIREFEYTEAYNTTTFGAEIKGMKNVEFDNIPLSVVSNATSIILGNAQPLKIDVKQWAQAELLLINNVIALLAKNEFSPALVSAIVKSPILYQYLQAEILSVLQANMDDSVAEDFMLKAKTAIKEVVDLMQKNGVI